ncbi:ABC transporter substrate-binding protein [Microbacterium sp. PRF11]|uniref:ABC transporter substrate-binding protein n=1 Tax=Microbacterium sp. PRF11 TaxID=2962593 RepID=UPI002881EDF2|nr:ABC transporter substrate-binding protein [Microbacterium sp. PRF11]MDT0117666.1 ABC transporter substrate-binding protein [Microbacterium sp. PRF11]
MHHGLTDDPRPTRRRGRRARLLALLAAAGVVLAGCSAPEPAPAPQQEARTSLTVGVVGSLTSFNAASATGSTPANRAVSALLDENLGSLDGDLQVVPNNGLGRITRVQGDPLKVSYELFSDRVWSDGTPVTLDDLLFGWAVTSHFFDDATYDAEGNVVSGTRYFDTAAPADPNARTSRPILDRADDTLTLTYDSPFADWNRQWLLDRPVHVVAQRAGVSVEDLLTAILTAPEGDPTAPVEPNPVLAAAATAWNTGFDIAAGSTPDPASVVSAGPWTVAEATADTLQLARRDSYQGAHFPGLEGLTVRFFPDRAAQLSALEAGQVDIANVGDVDVAEQKTLTDAGLTVQVGPTTQTLHLRFGAGTASDLRQAMTLATDRASLVSEVLGAVRPDAQPLQSFLSSPATGELYSSLISGNGAPGTGADVDGARRALGDRAAVLRVAYDGTDDVSAMVFSRLVSMGARAGIAVRAATPEDTPDATLSWVGEDESLYRSARDRLAEGIDGPNTDELFDELTVHTDPVDVLGEAREIDRSLFSVYAGVPLLERTGAVATAAGVGGVGYTSEPDGIPPAFWTWSPQP